jgi:hypothetical protein
LGTHGEQEGKKKQKILVPQPLSKRKKTGSQEVTNPSAVPEHRMIEALHVLDLFLSSIYTRKGFINIPKQIVIHLSTFT